MGATRSTYLLLGRLAQRRVVSVLGGPGLLLASKTLLLLLLGRDPVVMLSIDLVDVSDEVVA